MMIAATAMGAHIIEKGVYPVGVKNDQDVNHAICIDDVGSIYETMVNVFTALGEGNDRNLFPWSNPTNQGCVSLLNMIWIKAAY